MRAWIGAFITIATATIAVAADSPLYTAGKSSETWEGRHFDIHVPEDFDADKEYSLVMTLSASLDDLAPLLEQDYILCLTHPNASNGAWATSEVKEVIELTGHLQKSMPIGEDRMHLVAHGESTHTISPMLAFHKKASFVSVCFDHSTYRRGSVAKSARKRMGVLRFGKGEAGSLDDDIVKVLTGKVRTVEVRDEQDGMRTPYFHYWIGVMEGRFTPGHTLSFDWVEDPETPDALAAIRKDAADKNRPLLVYFWSAEDADNGDAKALQNEVFFDEPLRESVRQTIAVKLDREKHATAFDALGLTKTPAVVLVDPEFAPTASFEGEIKLKKLQKAVEAATKAD